MCKKKNVYTMAELSLCMMKLYNTLNLRLFADELPKVIITFESGYKKGAYGWCYTNPTWHQGKNDEPRYCINVSADYLDRPIYAIASTLLHEMCHLYAIVNGIKDTSRAGIYHNKRFREIAESHGLHVEEADKVGWSVSSLADGTKQIVDDECNIKSIRIGLIRYEERPSTPKPKQSRRKYICPLCGLQVTATKYVSILCGDCTNIDSNLVVHMVLALSDK